MTLSLRAPITTDYDVVVSWILDASACARWAGPQLRFPFVAEELPELLGVGRVHSYSMVTPDNVLIGFGQFWLKTKKQCILAVSSWHLIYVVMAWARLCANYSLRRRCIQPVPRRSRSVSIEIIPLPFPSIPSLVPSARRGSRIQKC